jgi:hypothetical protein
MCVGVVGSIAWDWCDWVLMTSMVVWHRIVEIAGLHEICVR